MDQKQSRAVLWCWHKSSFSLTLFLLLLLILSIFHSHSQVVIPIQPILITWSQQILITCVHVWKKFTKLLLLHLLLLLSVVCNSTTTIDTADVFIHGTRRLLSCLLLLSRSLPVLHERIKNSEHSLFAGSRKCGDDSGGSDGSGGSSGSAGRVQQQALHSSP